MKIGLLSDTHSYLDTRIFSYFKKVDEIWHAGDIGSVELIDQLRNFKPLVGVYGNIDNKEIRAEFPEFNRFVRDQVSVLMTHIGGRPGRYTQPLVKELKVNGIPKIIVCGHSHILKVQFDQRFKALWLNPGACGNHGFHQIKTLLRFELNKGKIENMEVIELGPRGK